jgi:hypothetical protein
MNEFGPRVTGRPTSPISAGAETLLNAGGALFDGWAAAADLVGRLLPVRGPDAGPWMNGVIGRPPVRADREDVVRGWPGQVHGHDRPLAEAAASSMLEHPLSFLSERDHWIQGARTARGHVARDQRRCQEHNADRQQYRHVHRARSEKRTLHRPAERVGTGETEY